MAERDFDNVEEYSLVSPGSDVLNNDCGLYFLERQQSVALDEENDSKAVIQVGLESFSSKNEVSYSFTNGGLRIAANVDGKVYSKTIKGLTDTNVDVVEIKKSSGSFKVILKKKKRISLHDIFF